MWKGRSLNWFKNLKLFEKKKLGGEHVKKTKMPDR